MFFRLVALLLAVSCSLPLSAEPSWFGGIAAGAGQHDTDLDINSGTIDLLFEPSDDGDVISFELGYEFNDHWFAALEYSLYDADDSELENIAASINYQWRLSDKWKIYAGILAGESTLEWQEDPIFATTIGKENDETLRGAQLGFKASLNERWSLTGKYQFLGMDHETRLEPNTGSGDFTHEKFHFLTLGMQVAF